MSFQHSAEPPFLPATALASPATSWFETRRARGVLSWHLPASYFAHLRRQGQVAGAPRALDFHFDAASVYRQFEAVLTKVRAHEVATGQPSGFEAGNYHAPTQTLDEQLARAETWHHTSNGARRFVRHIGTRAGQCAGAPCP